MAGLAFGLSSLFNKNISLNDENTTDSLIDIHLQEVTL